jgi:hypothetical protein
MSKKPLLSEGTARRWAKYAGIQNESNTLLSEMYTKEKNLEEEALEEEALEEGETLEEADVLAELEAMLAEQDEEEDPMDEPEEDEGEPEEGDEDEDMEDELDVDAEEAEADEAAMMSQEDVEAALKAGLEAMASAVADALKIKIDVRSGDEGEEMEAEEEVMEMMGEPEVKEGHGMKPHGGGMEEADLYEGIDRTELVERVMKRVAARLVKESKEG